VRELAVEFAFTLFLFQLGLTQTFSSHIPYLRMQELDMRIFITGVADFLSSHLAYAMLKDGHQVVGIDNLVIAT
jgi:hypothetical protein